MADWLLRPELSGDEPGRLFASAFSLVEGGRRQDLEAVITALGTVELPARTALQRALGVVAGNELGPQIDARLLGALATTIAAQPEHVPALLDVLATRQIDPGLPLEPLVGSVDPALQTAALRAARFFPARLHPDAIARGLRSAVAEVRAAAIEAGLVLAHPATLPACQAIVRERGPGFATAALALGLSGEASFVTLLATSLAEPRIAKDAAFALGFSGRVAAADCLSEALAVKALARVAAESFSHITGLALEQQFTHPVKPWNSNDGDAPAESPDDAAPDMDLPEPNAAAISGWWRANRARFEAAERWVQGQRWSEAQLERSLIEGPAYRRAALAWDLAARSHGKVQVTWDALSRRQRLQLRRAHGHERSRAD